MAYLEMCSREGSSLQRGMNFRLRGGHSVVLMSVQPNAPYRDRIEEDGTVLIYEGHDLPRSADGPIPKMVDQPDSFPSGRPTENGKFFAAARSHSDGGHAPDLVQVYEKLRKGIWSDNGLFHLKHAWTEQDENRQVYKFKLVSIEGELPSELSSDVDASIRNRSRIIPSSIKLEVWKRDAGKCTLCGSQDELHFDHIVPYSKGGTSLVVENVQLLCARHNLQKSAKIE